MSSSTGIRPWTDKSSSDFTVPPTLSLQISKSPTDVFYTSYALDALPRLNGGVSYVASEAVGEVSRASE